MAHITPIHLFVVGLALDLAGAVLLALGLTIRARDIAGLGTYQGISYGALVDRVRSRVDAEFGLTALGLGFFLQFLGSLPGYEAVQIDALSAS